MTPTDPHKSAAGQARVQDALDRHHAQHGHTDHDGLYNEDVAHEYSDVDVRSLLAACVGMIAIVAVVAVAMWGLFEVFESQAVQNDPVISPLAVPVGQLPPEPRLLTDEPLNLQTIKTGERQVLDSYSWVDQQAGKARMPIEEAKKRLLHDGLPVRAGAPVEPWMGTHAASRGESSGGRVIPLRPGVVGPQQPVQPAAGQPKPSPAAAKSGGH